MLKKTAIPERFDPAFARAVKENLEIITGRRPGLGKLAALSRQVTLADVVNAYNRLLDRLQDTQTGELSAEQVNSDVLAALGFSDFVQGLLGKADGPAFRDGIGTLRRNVLINGDFNIWQAGTSWTGVTSLQRAADMWLFFQGGTPGLTGAYTVERSTDVPTQAQAGRKLNYSLSVTCTTADTTVSGSDNAILDVRVEGYDYAPLFGREQTLQFWVKSNKVGTYCVAWLDSANTEHYIAEFTVDAADTWEKKTITISGVPSVGTWDFTNGRGLRLIFGLVAGPDQQASAGAWAAGAQFATANQVNFADTVGNYIRLTDVRLVPGTDAENIYIPSFAEQLAMCERYYEKSYRYSDVPGTPTTAGLVSLNLPTGGTEDYLRTVILRTTKRAIPSVTTYSYSTGASGVVQVDSNDRPATIDLLSEHSFRAGWSNTGTTKSDMHIHYVADARLS